MFAHFVCIAYAKMVKTQMQLSAKASAGSTSSQPYKNTLHAARHIVGQVVLKSKRKLLNQTWTLEHDTKSQYSCARQNIGQLILGI